MTKAATTAKEAAQGAKLQKQRDARDLDDTKGWLATHGGRRWLYRIVFGLGRHNDCRFLDGAQAYYRDGQQNVGGQVLQAALDAMPEVLALALKEYQDDPLADWNQQEPPNDAP